jgi:hypothetical protein
LACVAVMVPVPASLNLHPGCSSHLSIAGNSAICIGPLPTGTHVSVERSFSETMAVSSPMCHHNPEPRCCRNILSDDLQSRIFDQDTNQAASNTRRTSAVQHSLSLPSPCLSLGLPLSPNVRSRKAQQTILHMGVCSALGQRGAGHLAARYVGHGCLFVFLFAKSHHFKHDTFYESHGAGTSLSRRARRVASGVWASCVKYCG